MRSITFTILLSTLFLFAPHHLAAQSATKEKIVTILSFGREQNSKGLYQEALDTLMEGLKIIGSQPEINLSLKANYLDIIGSVKDNLAMTNEAKESYQQGILLCQGIDSLRPILGSLYNNLGLLYSNNLTYDSASLYLHLGLTLAKSVNPPKYQLLQATLNNLSELYLKQVEFDSSLHYTNLSLDNLKKHLPQDSLSLSSIYNSFGTIYQKIGDFKLALSYLDSSLLIRENVLGLRHPRLIPLLGNKGTIYDDLGMYDDAYVAYARAMEIASESLSPQDLTFIKLKMNLATNLYRNKKYVQAAKSYQECKELIDKKYGQNHYFATIVLNNLASLYSETNEIEKAIDLKSEVLTIRNKILPPLHPAVANAYNNLGSEYLKIGNMLAAEKYLLKALNLKTEIFPEDNSSIASTILNIAILYQQSGDLEKASTYGLKAISINTKVFGPESENLFNNYTIHAIVLQNMGDYANSIIFSKKAINILHKNKDKNSLLIAREYNNLGNTFHNAGMTDSAYHYLTMAKETFDSEDKLNESYPKTFLNLGKVANSINQYEEAEKNYQLALEILYPKKNIHTETVISIYTSLAELHLKFGQNEKGLKALEKAKLMLVSRKDWSPAFIAKINFGICLIEGIIQERINTNKNQLKGAILAKELYQQAIDLFQQTEAKGYYGLPKLAIAYEQLLRANLQISTLENLPVDAEVFSIPERSKQSVFRELLSEENALTVAEIPKELLKREKNIKLLSTYYEKEKQQLLIGQSSQIDSSVLQLSSLIYDLSLEYDSLISGLETNYPKYYQAKYDLSTTPLEEVQQSLLSPNQTLLEYFLGDTSLFVFVVKPGAYEVKEVRIDSTFHINLTKMTRAGIYGYYNAPKSRRSRQAKSRALYNYAEAAAALYQKLILPVKDQLTSELIIVPDGALGYVPFEALLKERPGDVEDYSTYHYLLEDYQISYSYSATLLKEMRDKQHTVEPPRSVLALAPFYTGNADSLLISVDTTDYAFALSLKDSLSVLPASGEEVKAISNTLAGQAFYGEAASISTFQNLAPDYRVLHLSTHGKADDRVGDYAYLAFGQPDQAGSFSKLYARDLYNMTLNADMVVLSACETGVGKLQRGEGIISLARGFAYAGAKSIFTTLWSVEENTTKEISIAFYQHLKAGLAKDAALRQAKLDYLQDNAENAERLHPFFWAGMVGIGDMRPLVIR